MMCYKDMTFCNFYKECSKGGKCEIALTDKVIEAARRWMKDPPICVFKDKPECFEEFWGH